MQGALQEFANQARTGGKSFNVPGAILIPNEGGKDDVITEGRFHRIDRRVTESEADGFVLRTVQRQYLGARNIAVPIEKKLESGEIAGRELGGGSIGGSSAQGTRILGYQARAGFLFHDKDEDVKYPIEGVQYLSDKKNLAVTIERNLA